MTAPRDPPGEPPSSAQGEHSPALRERLDALRLKRPRGPQVSLARPAAAATGAAEALGGRELRDERGACWIVETPIERVRTSDAPGARPATCAPAPTAGFLVDIETGGFSGTPVFLIGVLPLDRPPLQVIQWLARDYPEEEAILRRFAASISPESSWASFNGRAFDEPFLRDRATRYGVALAAPSQHIDLLHLARRRWKHELSDCRLETIERAILGRTRPADVPGALIPDLFHHFCRTGNAAPLAGVLEHNRRDLVACYDLWMHMSA